MWNIGIGQGKHGVGLQIIDTGQGCCGLVSGGEKPHIGGVVLAAPRPSLTGQGQSCDLWIMPLPGHKDTEVAAPLARRLCLELGVSISLSAGIHIEQATPEDLQILMENCQALGEEFLSQYKAAKKSEKRME